MPARLTEIHRRLRADNVPSAVEYHPALGTVVLAGVDHAHPAGGSAVVLHEGGGRYWIRQGGRTFPLPPDADDEVVVNSVKLRVVHAWAEQGDPDAVAVLARVRQMAHQRAPRPRPAEFPDPFALAFEMFDTALRIGWSMTVPGPLGVFRFSFGIQ